MAAPLPLSQPLASPGDLQSEAPLLERGALDALAAWAERAASTPQAVEWRRQAERWLEAREAGAVAHAAYALLLEPIEPGDEAIRQWLVLCDRLSQVGAWDAVSWIAERVLALRPEPQAARWLVRAADERADAEEILAALERAHAAAPGDPGLGWRLAQLLESRGRHEDALTATAESLAAMIRRKDLEALDEVFLYLLEEPRRETLRLVFPAFPLLARSGQGTRLADYLETCRDSVLSLGLARDLWPALREALEAAPAPAPLLRQLPAIVEAAHPQGAAAVRVLELSGLLDGAPAKEALAFFDRALPYAPGCYVEHNAWGAGRVVRLDRDEIRLDFAGRSGHRMTLRAAQQALAPIDAEDLAVLASFSPDELARRREEDPVDLVARALVRSRGEAELSQLKRILVHYAVPEKEWARFWKTARARLEADPRVDATRAYRGHFRLAERGTEETAEAPRFDRGADAQAAIPLLQRFLAQHAGREAEVAERNASALERWRADASLPWRTRFEAAALLVLGGGAAHEAAAERLAAAAFQAGFDLRELPSAADQARVLRWGLATPAWAAAAVSAFGSRSGEIRELGLKSALERHGEGARAFLEDAARAARTAPDAALQVATWAFGGRAAAPDLPPLSPWPVALGLAELLESGATPPQARAAGALLAADGPLAHAARATPPDEDTLSRLARLVRHWRSSDRHLHGVLAWLEAAGHGELAGDARTRQRQAARAVTARARRLSPYDVPQLYLTRASFGRMKREAEDVQQALRTTIPAAIQKARELGDLRENAEYESARLKQRTAQARLEQLAERMGRALFIDDVEEEAGVVGLGSEVTLELESGGTRRYWILGEGDAAHGGEVVSYLAPIGRALYGRRPGERVELPEGERSVPATIRSLVRRLPPAAAPTSSGAEA
jgi:transcription elongation factor GreA